MQEFFRFLLCPVIDNMNKSHSRTLNQPLANKTLVKSNYLLKVNNRNTRTRCEICSKLTIKIPERRQRRYSGIFTVNFEQISHPVLVFLLLTLSI